MAAEVGPERAMIRFVVHAVPRPWYLRGDVSAAHEALVPPGGRVLAPDAEGRYPHPYAAAIHDSAVPASLLAIPEARGVMHRNAAYL